MLFLIWNTFCFIDYYHYDNGLKCRYKINYRKNIKINTLNINYSNGRSFTSEMAEQKYKFKKIKPTATTTIAEKQHLRFTIRIKTRFLTVLVDDQQHEDGKYIENKDIYWTW